MDPATLALIEELATLGLNTATALSGIVAKANSGTPITAADQASAKALTTQAMAASDAADKLQIVPPAA